MPNERQAPGLSHRFRFEYTETDDNHHFSLAFTEETVATLVESVLLGEKDPLSPEEVCGRTKIAASHRAGAA